LSSVGGEGGMGIEGRDRSTSAKQLFLRLITSNKSLFLFYQPGIEVKMSP